MATVIKLKRGTSTPTTSDLANGEVAIDTSARKFYINDGGTVKEIGGSASATITALNNQSANRLTTIGSTTTELDGEANLTFDGSTLGVTGVQTITNTTTNDSLLITTTEDSADAGPVLTFKRNSGSPADGDYLGQLKFKGENDADQEVIYAKMTAKIDDASDTTEDGLLEFTLKKAGSNNIGMRLTSTQLKLLNSTTLDLGSQKITSVADPTANQDAATKAYVDANAGGGDVTWQSVHSSDGSTVLNVSASKGYFIDTSTIDGAATAPVSLPSSPSVGDKIILVDYKGTSSTNNIEINPNGNKLLGSTNTKLVRDDRSGIILVYSGSDVGWVITAGYVEPDDGLVGAPGAPTIGTASLRADGVSIDVPFTAPTDDGGNTITSYTATSSPGGFTGTLNQAGSGTIVVSGLDLATAYTFTVTATNSIGTGPASAASNSVTTTSETFIAATGGTETTSGDYKIHTFTGSGCFEVTALGVFCCGGTATTSNKVSYLVVAGGGGGGRNHGGSGGAGGFREGKRSDDPYTASPLDAGDGLVVTANPTTYPISVGGGGSAGSPAAAPSGSGSTFSTITSAGGGGGGGRNGRNAGNSGGSGGGGSHNGGGGSGNSPSVSPPQGTNGSGASGLSGGRGGSALTSGSVTPSAAAGAPTNITGSDITYSSAAGGGGYSQGASASPNAANRGASGYGGHAGFGHGQGGSKGVVIIRYKYQSS